MKFVWNFFKGILIGAGAILPGISSGVLCVIFGIYDKLVSSIVHFFKDWKKNFSFLFPICLGTGIGIILFGNALRWLFINYSTETKFTFIGLILGSIPLLVKEANKKKFHFFYVLFFLFTFILSLFLIYLENYIPTINIENVHFFYLFICGLIMSIGVVVPGVSSTVILMCFGVYETYIAAIASMNLSILIPMGIGVVTGSIIFLSVIRYLFKHYYMQTFYAIIGFSLGSIFVLYMPLSFDITGFISLVLFISFFYIAGKLENL